MRRFVVIGQKATAGPEFSLDDLPGTSGRLDVLLRCVRAALLVSHGVRRDTLIYLVLNGGPLAPRTVRIDGATAEYLRPDERSLAGAMKSMLSFAPEDLGFDRPKRGVAIQRGGLDAVLADIGTSAHYILDERARDVRDVTLAAESTFFLGDHIGLDDASRARLASAGAISISIGPVSVHADDAIAVLTNELDRRDAKF